MRRVLATVAAVALLIGLGPSALAASPYEAQSEHPGANFSLTDGNAGAVTFTTGAEVLDRFGAWVVSRSTTGAVTASVRTDVTDPTSEVAGASVELGALGGTGSGWLEFDFDGLALESASDYSVMLRAEGTDADVTWHGNRSPVEGAIPSWNYDEGYWGGWVQYGLGPAERFADWNLSFYVNDALTSTGCTGVNECWRHVPVARNHVDPAGLLGTPGASYALSAFQAVGATYVPGSSVLELPHGNWFYMPTDADEPRVVPAGHEDAGAQVAAGREWLAAGDIPGSSDAEREMAARALLDLRLLLQENGAAAAAAHGIWSYSWPRDTAFMAVAFARSGHLEEARRILRYSDETLRRDCTGRSGNCVPGTWDARTLLDGSGPPDGRPWQLDANGFVPWAVWQYVEALPAAERNAAIDEFYDMVRVAADYATASLGSGDLPPARPDYWESAYPAPNLGTAAPLLSGLRAAAGLAEQAGQPDDAERWFAAADRLAHGIDARFGRNGYQRTIVDGSGKDSAITWLAPPFNPAGQAMWAAIDETWEVLREPTGGVKPGEVWTGSESWTPETMFFALAWANGGSEADARALVEWMQEHRTTIGAFPEKITPGGHPAAVSTLGWTASLTLLTLAALDRPLPTPPTQARGAEPRLWAADEQSSQQSAPPADTLSDAGYRGTDEAESDGSIGSSPAGDVLPTGADGKGGVFAGLPVSGVSVALVIALAGALMIGGRALRRRRGSEG